MHMYIYIHMCVCVCVCRVDPIFNSPLRAAFPRVPRLSSAWAAWRHRRLAPPPAEMQRSKRKRKRRYRRGGHVYIDMCIYLFI